MKAIVLIVDTVLSVMVAMFALVMLLPSCGSGDGSPVVDDFFLEYYAECVDMCDEVRAWDAGCGSPHARMADDCVEHVWWEGHSQKQCDVTARCYAAMLEASVCLENYAPMQEDSWYPPMHENGCPVPVPEE